MNAKYLYFLVAACFLLSCDTSKPKEDHSDYNTPESKTTPKSKKEIVDPCQDSFNPNFSKSITQQFFAIVGSKIYSYPFLVLERKAASPDISAYTTKEFQTGCGEVILELNYKNETKLHNESSIKEVVRLFFLDPQNKVEKLNLRLISELPTQNEYYTKSKIETAEFENSMQLELKLVEKITIADSSACILTGSSFSPNYNGKSRLQLEFASETNPPNLDEQVFLIVQEHREEIKKKKVEELVIIIKVYDSNFYETKDGKIINAAPYYQYHFNVLDYFINVVGKRI